MANVLESQVTEDGVRNAVVKLTGILDTSDITEIAVDITKLSNPDERSVLVGLRVDLIEYSISNGIEVQLAWDSNVPQQIYPLSGRGRISATNYGGFIPDRSRSGYTGSIKLTTNGYAPGTVQNFTIVLELVKLYTV